MVAAPRAVSTSAVLALVLTAVWLFWPTTLGGGTTYVATHGDSMEPAFSTGDLALLRAASSYAVGDVVAYRSKALDTVVMHRIVSGDAAGYVTQGDNNDWLDPDEPSHDQIMGSLFFGIPRGAIALDAITSPGALVFLVGGLLTVFGFSRQPAGRRRPRTARRRRTARSMPAASVLAFSVPALSKRVFSKPAFSMPAFSTPTRSLARQAALASGAVALVALVGGGGLLMLPSTQTDARTVQVTQEGQFSYTGPAEPGTTYPSGVVETGDTVWTRLAERVTVSFTNTVRGPELTEVRGDLRLDVIVTASDGWSAVVTRGPVAALENGTATASVVVDPAAAGALLSRHYAEIGSVGGGSTLTVTPVGGTTGLAEGRSFTAQAPAGLPFTLDAASLRPAGDDAALTPAMETDVAVEEVAPRTLPLLASTVPIDVARLAAGGVLTVALLVLAAGAWVGRTGRGDVADQFLVRHAHRILPVAGLELGSTIFDVADAESLHRVAERFDTLVLHHAGPDEDVFAVRDADATYRFVVPGTPDRRRGKPPVPGAAAQQLDVPAAGAPVPLVPDPTVPLPRITEQPRDLAARRPRLISIPPPTGGHWGHVA